MTITSLMDDFCPHRGFRGEHGLSLFIEHGSTRLLFDTGQSAAFLENARKLGIALDSLDAVALSHGHYDHGGGLFALYESLGANPPPLYAGRGFDEGRFASERAQGRDIGLPRPFLPETSPRATIVDSMKEIAEGLYIMPKAEMLRDARIDPRFRAGALGSAGSPEAPGGGAAPAADRPDLFEDELSLVCVDDAGLTVVTGCAHRGILNIVAAARRAFPDRPLRAIVGGFHLGSLPDGVLAEIARDIAALVPASLFPCHCTSMRGFAALDAAFHKKATWLFCGMKIQL